MAIQIGKYKRPGLFLNELDESLFSTPGVEGITNLVIGVSKKGPVNTPIRLTTITDLEAVFGQLDRNLERKGSFFHRTVSKMLETTPVYAMNLLLTDDNLDVIEYKSLSASAGYKNASVKNGPYRRIFDTTGFWKRDTEAFINLTKNDVNSGERAFSFTNLSDRAITVFVVKTQVSGFDRTLLEWYGSVEKMPTYVSSNDYASDFMVDVVVVGGDWTDYAQLAVDNRWSQYFNSNGLIKGQLRNFANDRNMTLLGYYEGASMIPYFRDSAGKNIFIETLINRDTDISGLYCAFNSDLVEQDFNTGLIDLIGSTLVDADGDLDDAIQEIDFLSYRENITEEITFNQTPLDYPGNVFTLFGATSSYIAQDIHSFGTPSLPGSNVIINGNRTSWFAEGAVNNVVGNYTITGSASVNVKYNVNNDAFAVIAGKHVEMQAATFSFTLTANDLPVTSTSSSSYITNTYVLSNDGLISNVQGILSGTVSKPIVNIGDIVLGYTTCELRKSGSNVVIMNSDYTEVSVGDNSRVYNNLVSLNDYVITSPEVGDLKIEFIGTNDVSTNNRTNYEQIRKVKAFNELLNYINSKKGVVMLNIAGVFEKVSLSTMSVTNVVTAPSQNKSLVLKTGINSVVNFDTTPLTFYKLDNEFILGSDKLANYKTAWTSSNNVGIVSKYSKLYQDYFNGIINTGDYFVDSTDKKFYLKMFVNLDKDLEVEFVNSVFGPDPITTTDYIGLDITSEISNFKQTLEIENVFGYVEVPNKVLVDGSRYSEVKVGDFLLADNDNVVLQNGEMLRNFTRILHKRQYAGNTALTELTCDSKISKVDFNGDRQTTRYSTVDQYAKSYKGIALKGFKIREASLPDGTEQQQNKLLNLVAKGTPLFKALTNKEAFNFRYLIDGFGLGLTERSKQQLVDICGERLDAFGFINMPSLKSFKNSSSPTFVNAEGVLQAEFIAKGGDPESNPAFLYSFAEGDGNTCVGYFTPYVSVNDNGRPLSMPPAAHVASTYIRKHISIVSAITPWTIAAGVTNGKVTNITSVEHEFDPTDIEFLNQAQMNPIVLKRNRGYIIETENTALTLYKSALSVIHVREVLIELERELGAMLLDYQWKFNTPDVRAEIKLRADVICETYVNKNGLYNYFNKMDDENNDIDVIDSQIGVLDTYVEPIKGMGIIVNNVTILRTGAIASGGFINY